MDTRPRGSSRAGVGASHDIGDTGAAVAAAFGLFTLALLGELCGTYAIWRWLRTDSPRFMAPLAVRRHPPEGEKPRVPEERAVRLVRRGAVALVRQLR